MIDGIFKAYEYSLTVGGKNFSGKCEGITKDTKFEGLSDSQEDKMISLGIIMGASVAHKFEGGEDKSAQRYYISLNGGDSWMNQQRRFRMDGDKVVLTVRLTGEDVPESESGTMILNGDLLVVTKNNTVMESTMVFKKV